MQNGNLWQVDMIHILSEPPYVGYFENIFERISKILTYETREAINVIIFNFLQQQRIYYENITYLSIWPLWC